ncbi:cation diffusion facilitator-like protein [Coleophoma crateriformis]|uniref:Cation diffusion facilitator-like protein n=1 Tax=Coleophoma crateriformis TaxID=565419 RepID=A0A3D8T1L0_9HELO|nr:cation diffusion facilitator-like protein [Coleophoma crateriformis]
MAGKRGIHGKPTDEQIRRDLEQGRPRSDRKYRFRDHGYLEPDDQRRVEFKKKLMAGVDCSNLESFRKSDEELKKIKNKKVRQFYEVQNQRLDDWLEVNAIVKALSDDILESFDPRDENGDGVFEGGGGLQDTQGCVEPFLPEEEQEKRRIERRNAKWAININVLANIILLVAKGIASFYSSSLSLIASLVDSALDLLCTGIIFSTSKLVQWHIHSLRKKFPVGRRRLEPLGILVFSIIMIISFIQILEESVSKLMSKGPHKAASLPPIAIGAMAATIGLKGFIWIGCARIKSTQVQALAQDCKTDVVFNTLSLIFPAIGHAADVWWLDPLGAGLLSLFIIYDWAMTCIENVSRLTGAAVDDRVLEKLTFLAWRFSPLVNGYKSITAYHAGDGVWVEVDILLDEKTPLEHAHDVAETLQYCCEGMPEVDRAFVTCDYAWQGPTGHASENFQ